MDDEEIRVVVADDNPGMRQAIRTFLEKVPGISVIGEANNGQEAIHLTDTLCPDIVILDIQMPVMDGLATLIEFQRRDWIIPVLILSGSNDWSTIMESMNNGAHSYILKEDGPGYLVDSIYRAVRGQVGVNSPGVQKIVP